MLKQRRSRAQRWPIPTPTQILKSRKMRLNLLPVNLTLPNLALLNPALLTLSPLNLTLLKLLDPAPLTPHLLLPLSRFHGANADWRSNKPKMVETPLRQSQLKRMQAAETPDPMTPSPMSQTLTPTATAKQLQSPHSGPVRENQSRARSAIALWPLSADCSSCWSSPRW